MKRNLFAAGMLLLALSAQAQIPNGGFENIDTETNNIDDWGKAFLMAIIIDSSGETHTDSIVFDNALYFPSFEPHSGMQAMEMRNAYNYTTDTPISGGAVLSPDDSYAMTFTPPQVPIQPFVPTRLQFYYQYYPIGLDSAMATLGVYDADGWQIGQAEIRIGGTVAAYTLADVPIDYWQPGTVSFISLVFSTSVPNGDIQFGTRFLVDDVSLEGPLGISGQSATGICIYPNPATGGQLFVSSDHIVQQLSVQDAAGKTIAATIAGNVIDCSEWRSGVYFFQVATAEGNFRQRIVIP